MRFQHNSFQFANLLIQNLHKCRRLKWSNQGWRHHHPINCQQCSESLCDETITKMLIFLNFSLFDRSQLCSQDCVALVRFRVSHDSNKIKIAQLMEITQPMKQLSQTSVHHLKLRNVKASLRSRTCFQNKSCSSSRRSSCHGLTDSNIVQSFSTSRLQCEHNFSNWRHVTRIHKF